MLTMIQGLAHVCAFACALLGIHLLSARASRSTSSIVLGILFLIMAFQSILISIVLEYGRDKWAIFLPPLALLIGPLLMMYFESIADQKYRFTATKCLHYLPALFAFFEMAAGVFFLDPDLMIVMSFAFYTAVLLMKAVKGRTQFSKPKHEQSFIFSWLVFCCLILASSLFGEVFILYELHQGTPINNSTALLVALFGKLMMVSFILMGALRTSSPLVWISFWGTKSRQPAPRSADDIVYRTLVSEFDNVMVEKKLYVKHEVLMQNIAEHLAVSQRHLSRAINHVHGESFSKRMNRLRVSEAKRLLSEPTNISITEVMFDSGFRTKSNFNKEFLAIEGVSPSEFRESNINR